MDGCGSLPPHCSALEYLCCQLCSETREHCRAVCALTQRQETMCLISESPSVDVRKNRYTCPTEGMDDTGRLRLLFSVFSWQEPSFFQSHIIFSKGEILVRMNSFTEKMGKIREKKRGEKILWAKRERVDTTTRFSTDSRKPWLTFKGLWSTFAKDFGHH